MARIDSTEEAEDAKAARDAKVARDAEAVGDVEPEDLAEEMLLLVRGILAASVELQSLFDRVLEPIGLSTARWMVLGAVFRSADTVARLARRLGLRRQGVQRIVNALAAKGIVELEDNPHHRRAKVIRLTAAGAVLLERSARAQGPWLNALAGPYAMDMAGLHEANALLASLRGRLKAGIHPRIVPPGPRARPAPRALRPPRR